jgi:large subunit ribosomal protein L25
VDEESDEPMELITLKGEVRKSRGTRSARSLRSEGKLPAVIYGHGRPPESVALSHHDVIVALGRGVRMLQVDVDGQAHPYLIKEVQYDHLGSTPIHLDLARVKLDERVRVRIGIELRGVPKGLSEGGVLEQYMGEVEVECLAAAIPDTLHPLVNELALGQALLVKDLQLPPGVVAVSGPDDRVAAVRLLAVAPEAVVAAPVEGEVAEPERIGRVRKEETEVEAAD